METNAQPLDIDELLRQFLDGYAAHSIIANRWAARCRGLCKLALGLSEGTPLVATGALGRWVEYQRRKWRTSELSTFQQQCLESVPGWSWDTRAEAWDSLYEKLAEFVQTHRRRPRRRAGSSEEMTLAVRLDLGVRTAPAQATAMLQLARDTPAPVLVDLLGFSEERAETWRKATARDWIQYPALRPNPAAP